MRRSLQFNAHVTCWLLPWFTHTLCSIQQTQRSNCYTLCWDELHRSMHVTCSLLQRVLGTRAHTVFSKRIQCYCYTLCWDELYRSMHMSHADYYHDSHIHCVQFSKRNAVIVTQSVGTSFTVQCTSHAHYYKACWGHTCTHCIQQTDTMLLLHTVMGQSLRFNAHVACSLTLRASLSGTFLQVKEGCRKPVLEFDAHYYNACWGLAHTLYSTNGYNAIVTHCDGTVFTV